MLYATFNNFLSCRDEILSSWILTSTTKQWIKCIAQERNKVTPLAASLEVAIRSL